MSNKTTKNKGIKLIKKSNDLIEARYKFDIWETRIFSAVLSQIDMNDSEFRVYRIFLRDIIKDFSINNGNAYDLLRSAANSLMNKKFFLDYETDGAERKKVYHIIRSVDYMEQIIDESKRHLHEYIDISIDSDMRPLLIQLRKQFTTYDVRNIIKFKSGYTVRIYEFLKQYESIGHRKIDVETLKNAFEITEEYPLFANFYQKVIEPAYRDINEYTDIEITEIEKLKNGKRVIALNFVFHRKAGHDFKKKKTQKPLELPFVAEPLVGMDKKAQSIGIDALFMQYQSRVVGVYGVAPTVFISELDGKTQEQVEQAIIVTETASKQGNLTNVAGFFIEALRKGFTNVKVEKKAKASQVARAKAEKQSAAENYQQSINEKIRILTAKDSSITKKAIEKVIASTAGRFRLKTLGIDIPEVEHFRKDEILREFVKMEIMTMFPDEFI